VEIRTSWLDVTVPDVAEPMSCYLARPDAPGDHPTVLVGFEMFGVTEYVRSVADRVAGLGYTAAVPDFYHRSGRRISLPATAEGRTRGLELLSQVTRAGVSSDVEAVLARFPSPAAMIGLSVGGHLAYYTATQFPLAAVATFYPGWLTDDTIALGRPEPTLSLTPGIAKHGTKLLFVVGADDHLFTPAQLTDIRSRLTEDGVDHEFVVYPDTPHGFFCHERDTYRADAAADAFSRVTALFKERLG
jgi:carboxymethylenebutenolidase